MEPTVTNRYASSTIVLVVSVTGVITSVPSVKPAFVFRCGVEMRLTMCWHLPWHSIIRKFSGFHYASDDVCLDFIEGRLADEPLQVVVNVKDTIKSFVGLRTMSFVGAVHATQDPLTRLRGIESRHARLELAALPLSYSRLGILRHCHAGWKPFGPLDDSFVRAA